MKVAIDCALLFAACRVKRAGVRLRILRVIPVRGTDTGRGRREIPKGKVIGCESY